MKSVMELAGELKAKSERLERLMMLEEAKRRHWADSPQQHDWASCMECELLSVQVHLIA